MIPESDIKKVTLKNPIGTFHQDVREKFKGSIKPVS